MDEEQSITLITQQDRNYSLVSGVCSETTPDKAVSMIRDRLASGFRAARSLPRLLILEKWTRDDDRYLESVTFAGSKQDIAPLLEALSAWHLERGPEYIFHRRTG